MCVRMHSVRSAPCTQSHFLTMHAHMLVGVDKCWGGRSRCLVRML